MSNSISIKHLTKAYEGNKAVDDLTLDIKQGEFFGFLGPNGAGKTTTIRILTGMMKADSGEALIDGKPLSKKTEIAQMIGALPESKGFYSWMTAFEYLSYFANLYGITQSSQKETIMTLLRKVRMEKQKNTPISTYSRGMKQRIALARALINKPKILFLDEPTLGLDPQGQADIQKLLQELHAQGVTIFLSSHLLPEVSTLCSYIAIIHHGKLVAQGTLEELRSRNTSKQNYIITVSGDKNSFTHILESSQVTQRENSSGALKFTFIGSEKEANAYLDDLRKKGVTIRDFHLSSDSLTDIFLELTKN